jgi:hypothetical protein
MLDFLDIPIPEVQLWETLPEETRKLAIAVLARRIIQATLNNPGLEEENRDR